MFSNLTFLRVFLLALALALGALAYQDLQRASREGDLRGQIQDLEGKNRALQAIRKEAERLSERSARTEEELAKVKSELARLRAVPSPEGGGLPPKPKGERAPEEAAAPEALKPAPKPSPPSLPSPSPEGEKERELKEARVPGRGEGLEKKPEAIGAPTAEGEKTPLAEALRREALMAKEALEEEREKRKRVEVSLSLTEEELKRARQSAEELQGQLASAARALAGLRSENSDLRAELEKFAGKVRDLERESREGQLTRKALDEQIGRIRADLDLALRSKEAEIAELKASYESLLERLRGQIEKREVDVERKAEHITIRMVERVLFASGSEQITRESRRTLDAVFEGLRPLKGGLIVIEGHADDRLIRPGLQGRFPSNWELSLARAAAVARHLEERGIDPKRISVTGYSYYRPADTNLTIFGRSQNRRVEIKLVPLGLSTAPAQ